MNNNTVIVWALRYTDSDCLLGIFKLFLYSIDSEIDQHAIKCNNALYIFAGRKKTILFSPEKKLKIGAKKRQPKSVLDSGKTVGSCRLLKPL
jgi:hypothetical protein